MTERQARAVANRGPRLELTWPGKDQFLLVPKDGTGKPVWVERDHPAASEVRLTEFTESCGDVDEDNPYADNLSSPATASTCSASSSRRLSTGASTEAKSSWSTSTPPSIP